MLDLLLIWEHEEYASLIVEPKIAPSGEHIQTVIIVEQANGHAFSYSSELDTEGNAIIFVWGATQLCLWFTVRTF